MGILLKNSFSFSFLFLFLTKLGGVYVQRISIKQVREFALNEIKIGDQLLSLTDHRKKCEITMPTLFDALLYTSILSKKSLLARDKLLRKDYSKYFFKSNRKMVASDSTLNRFLASNVETHELEQINKRIFSWTENDLVNPVLKKRVGIFDGSFLSNFFKEVFFIPGKQDFIYSFNTIVKRGKELVSAQKLISKLASDFPKGYFDLILGDGLYYSQHIFRQCKKELNASVLVKTSERLNVVKEAELIIDGYRDEIESAQGYDTDRMIKYKIEVVKNIQAETIDDSIQVAVITEKHNKGETEKFYVITNDLKLTPTEIRYAAHLRWRIENNGFKELSKLSGTKKKYLKNENCFTNLLWILIIAFNLLICYLKKYQVLASLKISKPQLQDIIELFIETLILCPYIDSS